MSSFIEFYQNIPFYLNPEIFSWGGFSLNWYSLMYLLGLAVIYALLRKRLQEKKYTQINLKTIEDFLFWSFLGLLIGARIGYVLFYDVSFYWENPWAIVSPFDPNTGEFIGIYGMSYHGGFLGALLVGWIFIKIRNIDFWFWADFIAPAIPAGYFLGRIGNFLNGELYGRPTEKFWGMRFPSDSQNFLRHPSQLYEAFLEGFLLFVILWNARSKKNFKNKLFALYILAYSLFRFLVEFFRQPDEQIGYIFGFLSLGQILSLVMFFVGIVILEWSKKTRSDII